MKLDLGRWRGLSPFEWLLLITAAMELLFLVAFCSGAGVVPAS